MPTFRLITRLLTTLCVLVPVVALAQAPDGWTVPRTADGRPDLQGVWANNNITPLERPEQWAGKRTLSDEELAELQAATSRVTASGNDAQFGDQLVLKALANIENADSYDTTGNYNQFWMADRDFTNRTSLVIQPSNGRIPPLTEEAQQRQAGARAYREAHPADGPEDRPLGERCANFGIPRIGAGYNSYVQIVQASTHIALVQEMAHDARIVPLDERPAVDDDIRLWHGDSRGWWEGDTLVVENARTTRRSRTFMGASDASRDLIERFTRVWARRSSGMGGHG